MSREKQASQQFLVGYREWLMLNYLCRKNKKGYYYPTSIDTNEVSVPKFLLEEACKALLEQPENKKLSGKLYQYLKED